MCGSVGWCQVITCVPNYTGSHAIRRQSLEAPPLESQISIWFLVFHILSENTNECENNFLHIRLI